MKKITKEMNKQLENGITPKSIKGKWDAGALFNVSMTWDAENYATDAKEVEKALRAYLKKWPGLKKFRIDSSFFLDISHTR